MTATKIEQNNIENGTRRLVMSALKELNVDFPWKKSVSWSSELEEVREYEKPDGKSYYRRLSDKIGKPRRVLINYV
tara:strand:- start:228 stop:455 length:228 start_codon:yes stop_codon:yes gene_type:complete